MNCTYKENSAVMVAMNSAFLAALRLSAHGYQVQQVRVRCGDARLVIDRPFMEYGKAAPHQVVTVDSNGSPRQFAISLKPYLGCHILWELPAAESQT